MRLNGKMVKKVEKIGSISTPIDEMVRELAKKKSLSLNELSALTGWSIEEVESTALVLEKIGIVDVHYPTLITKKPMVTIQKTIEEKKTTQTTGTKIDEYSFFVDFVPVSVKIISPSEEERPVYSVEVPAVDTYTKAFLQELKESITDKIPMDAIEVTDEKKSTELKAKFFEITKAELKKFLANCPESKLNILAGLILHSMYGLGKIEPLMADALLEEIAVNSSNSPVVVYHRKHGWLKTNVFMESEEEIYNYASQIARNVGREITTLNPVLDAHLLTGDRVNATLNPITSLGNTITIRKFARRPWTIIDFIGKSRAMNTQMAALLWLGVQYEMNLLIAGGTASGKTSTLNVLSAFIPSYHRIISIEDVREIMLPKHMHANWVPMTTRNPNPEGKGEVTMLELMQSSLRMRPDRIILGEIRRHREAEVLFEAMHTGHSIYSTIHANSSNQVLR
ncbi:MAG: ATPase, T2SS/T4P/T4SS family, partial [archaeon]